MSIIVSKFGGSSIADASGFRRVKEIITSEKRRQYIVLSAPGKRCATDEKMTDLLVHAHNLFSSGKDYSEPIRIIQERFTSIIRELQIDAAPDILFHGLDEDVRHSRDRAASRGEYLCAKLFSLYSGIPFIDAAELIFFDKDGRIQREAISQAVCAMASRTPYGIIPGFYGSIPDGSIKTFTRGGSDITGALIAAALNADVYENWTDVDGLMSIDPRISSDAQCHYAVSYRQMRMLAKAGAQVLHPYCVEPVCEAGIPTILKNTFAPLTPGTYISEHVRRNVPCVCAQNGFYAVRTDHLSDESMQIAKGLDPEKYMDCQGNEYITLKNESVSAAVPVCIISAFGLSPSMKHEALRFLNPIAYLQNDHCFRFLVLPDYSAVAQRILHELVMTAFTDSRTPSDCGEPCHSIR